MGFVEHDQKRRSCDLLRGVRFVVPCPQLCADTGQPGGDCEVEALQNLPHDCGMSGRCFQGAGQCPIRLEVLRHQGGTGDGLSCGLVFEPRQQHRLAVAAWAIENGEFRMCPPFAQLAKHP